MNNLQLQADWQPPDDFNPTEALIRNLVANAAGDAVNEAEMECSALAIATALFVQKAGMDIYDALEAAERLYDKGGVKVTYTKAEGLSVTIGELDEEAPS